MSDPTEHFWAAYEAGGVEALLPYVTDDVVWEEVSDAPGAQSWQGKEGMLTVHRRWEEELDGFHWERTGDPVELGGTTAAWPTRAVGRGRSSGVEVHWDLWVVCRFRDGLIEHAFWAETLDEARERLRG